MKQLIAFIASSILAYGIIFNHPALFAVSLMCSLWTIDIIVNQ